MARTALDDRTADFLAQKRIAVAGVSRETSRHPVVGLILRRLKAGGREVFAVNPNLEACKDAPIYPDLGSIPGGVDGVVIVTRPEITEAIVRDAVAAGVPRVWMHASSPNGSSVSPAAVDACRAAGIAVIAGACPMMYGDGVDFGHKCMRLMLKLSGGLPA